MVYLTLAALFVLAAGLIFARAHGRKAASPDYGHLTSEVWAGEEA